MGSHSQVILSDALNALRVMTERDSELAAFGTEMQRTLVPPLSYRGQGVEIHGQSIPKDEVGGDLVDLVTDDNGAVTYLADVCGHGLRAGVLMGMIKTAIRYGLMLRQPLSRLLEDLNRLLPSVKDAHMFATLAALGFDGSSEVEYISAGHLPLLHWRQRTGEVVRYEATGVPLGLFGDVPFHSQKISFGPGDLFVLVTDGVVETDEEPDARAGLERLANLVANGDGKDQLSAVSAAIRTEMQQFGPQLDDRSILLVRSLETPIVTSLPKQAAAGSAFPELLEAGWRKLLDGLAEEVTS